MKTRRQFLRASGVLVGLPFLESLGGEPIRRRLVAINIGLGLYQPNFGPTTAGRDYELTPYLEPLRELRNQFTVITGASHPEVGGGHLSGKSYLTCAPHPNSAGFRNSISLDQFAAAELGSETRFASLAMSSTGRGLSWSRSGVEIPSYSRASRVFQRLFLAGKPDEQARQLQRLQDRQSILDVVMDKSKGMRPRLSGRDRDKLDQYFEAVREAERRLAKAEIWQGRPKPEVDVKPPQDVRDTKMIIEHMRQLYDVMHLALETDSTRFVTYNFSGMNAVPIIPGVDVDYHNLSHHGKDSAKIDQLTIVETAIMNELARFLGKLASSELLDDSMVIFGSNLGNASSHDSKNMPMLMAGGPFKHGQHLAFDRQKNYPLPNLYTSVLHGLGMQNERFASATGTMQGLEIA